MTWTRSRHLGYLWDRLYIGSFNLCWSARKGNWKPLTRRGGSLELGEACEPKRGRPDVCWICLISIYIYNMVYPRESSNLSPPKATNATSLLPISCWKLWVVADHSRSWSWMMFWGSVFDRLMTRAPTIVSHHPLVHEHMNDRECLDTVRYGE